MSTDHKLRLRVPESVPQATPYVRRVRLDFADLQEISTAMSTIGDVEIKSGHTTGTGTTILELTELGLRELDDISFRVSRDDRSDALWLHADRQGVCLKQDGGDPAMTVVRIDLRELSTPASARA